MFGLSAGEILFIALLALVLFGNKNLPENIKKFWQSWHKSKKFFYELQNSVQDISEDLKKDLQFLHEPVIEDENKPKLKKPELKTPQHMPVQQEEIDHYQNEVLAQDEVNLPEEHKKTKSPAEKTSDRQQPQA